MFRDVAIKKELLSKIKEKLVAVKKHGEASKTIGDAGLTNADGVLAHLGFTVQWKGLDVSAATIALR